MCNNKANYIECKTLNETYIGTIKTLNRIVTEQAELLKSKHDTCCKYIAITVITIVLCVFFCICWQRNCTTDTKPCLCTITEQTCPSPCPQRFDEVKTNGEAE
jgi:hypothetical protein